MGKESKMAAARKRPNGTPPLAAEQQAAEAAKATKRSKVKGAAPPPPAETPTAQPEPAAAAPAPAEVKHNVNEFGYPIGLKRNAEMMQERADILAEGMRSGRYGKPESDMYKRALNHYKLSLMDCRRRGGEGVDRLGVLRPRGGVVVAGAVAKQQTARDSQQAAH